MQHLDVILFRTIRLALIYSMNICLDCCNGIKRKAQRNLDINQALDSWRDTGERPFTSSPTIGVVVTVSFTGRVLL